METEGPQERQGNGAKAESNVVRLPRDWLGPRDELVPFGPSAEPAGGDPEADVVSLDPEGPRGAADFWGEGSAAVQDALQAPTPPESERPASESRPRVRAGRRPAIAGVPLRVRAASTALAAGTLARARSSPVPIPALALFLAAVLAIAFVQIGRPGGSAPSRTARKATQSTGGGTGLAVVIPPTLFASKPRLPRASGKTPAKRSAPPRKPHVARKHATHAVHHTAAPQTASSSVSSAEPVTMHTTSARPVSSTTSSSTGSSTPVSTSGSAGSTNSGSGTSGSGASGGGGGGHSGPVGPGAPFGPGHLG